ncbi:MAG: insulinase family protein [Syntrophus sp. (in: bacteria)]|nr:insulinase family protein [Syntrophus sp. (in: bacteria)]
MKYKSMLIPNTALKTTIFLSIFFLLFSYPIVAAAAPPSLTDPDRIAYKPLSFTPPKAERVTLDNGLILYTLEDRELPLVKITAVIRTGSAFDPPEKEGLAELTGKVIRTGGIEGMTGSAIDETLESMAAILHTTINRDSGVFSLSVLRNDRQKGLELFSRILMTPVFEMEKLTLAKELKIEELRRIPDDAQKLAFREFGRLIHEGSPRGRLATANSINRIQRDDLIRFHRLFYQPKRVMISISGDIDRKEAETLVNRYFGNWQPSEEKVEPPLLPQPKEGRIYILPKDLSQSVVIFGWLAPAKKSAQFFPLEIVDFIVGSGGFRSRIFQEIRTNRGLAYSTGSFYTAKSDYGLFGAYALTKSESTVEVVSLLRGIIKDIGQKPVLPKELEMTKSSILNSFIFSFTSANQIALQQLMIEYEGLPEDYLITYRNNINNVNTEDVLKAARQHLDPEKAIILIIGNDKICKEISTSFKDVSKIENSL